MQIQKTNEQEPKNLNCLIYAHSSAGKTSAARTLKGKTLIVSMESGLLSLKDFKLDYISLEGKGMNDLKEALSFILKSDYENIYFDSLTEIADLFVEDAKLLYPDKRQALPMWGHYASSFMKFLKFTRDMKKNVFYTALAKTVKSNEGVEFYLPMVPGSISEKLLALFDFVFTIKIFPADEKNEEVRKIQTFSSEKWLCKTRSSKLERFEDVDLGKIIDKIFNKPLTKENKNV